MTDRIKGRDSRPAAEPIEEPARPAQAPEPHAALPPDFPVDAFVPAAPAPGIRIRSELSPSELALRDNHLKQIADLRERDALLASRPQNEATKNQREQIAWEIKRLEYRNSDLNSWGARPDIQKADQSAKAFLDQQAKAREKAALMAGKLWRGELVRRRTVMPSEIQGFLESNLAGFKNEDGKDINLRDLSRALAREIMKAVEKPGDIPKTGLRLFSEGQTYELPVLPDKESLEDKSGLWSGMTEMIHLPVGVWVRLAPDKKGIELELVGKRLGKGALKEVFQSRPLQVDLSKRKHGMQSSDAVISRSDVTDRAKIIGGIGKLRRFLTQREMQNPDFRVAGLLTDTDRVAGNVFEARDTEYAGDLFSLRDRKPEPSIGDRLQTLADAAWTLDSLHLKGLVHGDVKPENILVSKGDNPRGFVSDFDGIVEAGKAGSIHTSGYVDELFSGGLSTATADIFALANTTAELLFGYDPQGEHASPKSFEFQAVRHIEGLKRSLTPEQTQALMGLARGISAVLKENQQTSVYRDAFVTAHSIPKNERDQQLIDATKGVLADRFRGFGNFFSLLEQTYRTFKPTAAARAPR